VAGTIPFSYVVGGRAEITPDGRHAYVTTYSLSDSEENSDSNHSAPQVLVIDTASNTVATTIPMPGPPQGLAITANGRYAYIAVRTEDKQPTGAGADRLLVVDTAAFAVTATITIPGSAQQVVIPSEGNHVYIAADDQILVIDSVSNDIIAALSVDGNMEKMVIRPDGRRIYASFRKDVASSELRVIDTVSGTVSSIIPIPGRSPEIGIAPDGRHAYLMAHIDDTLGSMDAKITPTSMLIIDTSSDTVTATVSVTNILRPGSVVIVPDGRRAFAVGFGAVLIFEVG
jgi:DNA-binding beta-propeller fold protein YncE